MQINIYEVLIPMASKRLKEFLLVNFGLLLTAAGIVFFKAPNGFAMGGVSGISIILTKYFPYLNVGMIMLIINVVLNIVGLLMLGRDFGIKTIYSSFALSFFVWAGQSLFNIKSPLTGDTMLELMFAVILPAVGSAIVFDQNASTGGTDIVARLLTRYTHVHVGKTLLMADFAIALSAFFALGIRQGMYSLLGLIMKGFIIDIVIESMNESKKIEIVTSKPEEIEDYILREMHRGATVISAKGAYSGQERTILTAVLGRAQAIRLRAFVKNTDPHAFIVITNTSEIIGKGFRNTEL
jgi:uncharacterized membrane-anchored protein YitT (DUF2179 family)